MFWNIYIESKSGVVEMVDELLRAVFHTNFVTKLLQKTCPKNWELQSLLMNSEWAILLCPIHSKICQNYPELPENSQQPIVGLIRNL